MMRFILEELLDLGMKENEIYISMERNMKCAVGICGHCQIGKEFVCKDGPVFKFSRMKDLFLKREL